MPDSPPDTPEPEPRELKRVVVTLSDEALAEIESVTAELRELGLVVTDVQEFTGVVVGDWPHGDLEPLLAADGVDAAEYELPIQLPPPGSPIQ